MMKFVDYLYYKYSSILGEENAINLISFTLMIYIIDILLYFAIFTDILVNTIIFIFISGLPAFLLNLYLKRYYIKKSKKEIILLENHYKNKSFFISILFLLVAYSILISAYGVMWYINQ